MTGFESLLGVLLVAVLLAAAARRIGAPYPAFLAIGGAVLAFIPGAPRFTIDPEVALALFAAPVLLDAAYDASPRDLKDLWVPITSLAVVSVLVTTAAVAAVARFLMPGMPWPAAIALGAIVSPPDAAAAIAVLRQLRPPHRIVTILEGESLLNDASALLVYRLAVGAAAMMALSIGRLIPWMLLVLVGSVLAGVVLARIFFWLTRDVQDVPTSIILQFISTFGVWILADRLGLSAILTMVCYAIAIARVAPARTPARVRVPSYAVWETAVFVLNVLAFVFIGLQVRPILSGVDAPTRARYLVFAAVVLATVIVARIAWVMLHSSVVIWKNRRFGYRPPRPGMPAPTFAGSLIVSWAGMRGIVTLAAALALPNGADGGAFPYRGLIVLTAFAVVVGTLVLQGLTLAPLLRLLRLEDDDPVGREVQGARRRAVAAALAILDGDGSRAADAVRLEFSAHLGGFAFGEEASDPGESSHDEVHSRAVDAARRALIEMRGRGEIGDDAFHRLEEALDRTELGAGKV
ncbi:MAG TPA: sodium:proton antiporter [Thermoanaerobaculia bacterium]|nr:sodium:proton antiporter [Thermoanaerobaculia bacterium]